MQPKRLLDDRALVVAATFLLSKPRGSLWMRAE
jgi:hypothetical protein